MERILLIYGVVIAITFAVIMIALRGDESLSRKWAKVRVREDENHSKGIPKQSRMLEQPEEEFNMGHALGLAVFGMMMLLLLMLMNNM